MKTCILLYPGFVDYEVTFAQTFLKNAGEVTTVALTEGPFTSHSCYQCIPHKLLKDVSPRDTDIFIIPGGKPDPILNHAEVLEFLKELDNQRKVIAAICAAPIHLGAAGLLTGRQYTTTLNPAEHSQFSGGKYVEAPLVEFENIITAKNTAFLEFAVALAKRAGIIKTPQQEAEILQHFKNLG